MTSSQPSVTRSHIGPAAVTTPYESLPGRPRNLPARGTWPPRRSNYSDRMRRLRRWYAWWIRHAPRLRDIMFVGFSLVTIVAQAASGGNGWGGRDWYVLGVGVVASAALFWRRRVPGTGPPHPLLGGVSPGI